MDYTIFEYVYSEGREGYMSNRTHVKFALKDGSCYCTLNQAPGILHKIQALSIINSLDQNNREMQHIFGTDPRTRVKLGIKFPFPAKRFREVVKMGERLYAASATFEKEYTTVRVLMHTERTYSRVDQGLVRRYGKDIITDVGFDTEPAGLWYLVFFAMDDEGGVVDIEISFGNGQLSPNDQLLPYGQLLPYSQLPPFGQLPSNGQLPPYDQLPPCVQLPSNGQLPPYEQLPPQ